MSIPPLWRLAFRPFFLAGSLFAMLAIPLWVATWTGIWPGFQPTGGWLSWHRHEMLFGFAMAIVAGFLLTAGQTWTGQPGVSGNKLMALAAVWLLARLGWLFGLPLALVVPLDLLFMLGVTGLMARMLWVVRQKRNYPIVAVLTLMIGADVLVLCGIAQGNDGLQRQGILAGLWLVAALMAIIGGRVIPFFTQRGLGHTEAVKPWVWLDVALLVGTGLIAVLYAAGVALQQHLLIGVLFLAIATGHLLRLVRWYDGGIWRVPLLWSLHVAMLWLVVAAAGLALWNFGLLSSSSPSLHALSVGSMSGLILAMIARVTLGHTGRPLQLPSGIVGAFVLFNLGAASRVFLSGQWPVTGLWLAAICWALAFALYVWRYAPMLLSARVDGHPG
nr:NnrS family protein [Stutzerimonas stutzeri]